MNYLSLFSGMEAAHLAWAPLGWQCKGVAEIDPAACALLGHHLPHVPNLGSVTDITDEAIGALGPLDVVIGGSPCQDLSVAGKRKGLVGARSSLFHEQIRIFHAARTLCGARWLVWENVPGAFSSHRGRDFAVVVGALAGCDFPVPRDGWGNEGMALGPGGLVEWGVLDAQWFGVAQRRRRVFAVLDSGNWTDRPPVLLEPESLRGDSAPRREAGEKPAGCLTSSLGRRGGQPNDDNPADYLIPDVVGALTDGAHNGGGSTARTPTADASSLPPVAMCLNAGAMGRQDAESETLIPTGGCFDVAHSLTASGFDASGFDASEDGTGRGTPLVPVAFDTTQITSAANRSNPQPGDPCHPLAAGAHPPAIAFSCKDFAADAADELAPTLRSMGHESSHANGGGQVAVAFHPTQDPIHSDQVCHALGANANATAAVAFALRGREDGAQVETHGDGSSVGALRAANGGSSRDYVAQPMAVRRLTPRECERLQGAPDDWTLVPRKGKPMADGPRYKMLGNSFAVPVIRWIGQRIERAHRWAA